MALKKNYSNLYILGWNIQQDGREEKSGGRVICAFQFLTLKVTNVDKNKRLKLKWDYSKF